MPLYKSTTPTFVDTSGMFPQNGTHPSAGALLIPPPEKERDQNHEIAGFGLIRAAVAIGAGVFVLTLTLTAPLFLFPQVRSFTPAYLVFPLDLAIGVITAAILAIRWTNEAATRKWRIEDQERWRRWNLEDEQRQAAADALTPPAPPTQAELIRLAGYNILAFHYHHGREATRPECEKELSIPQSQWNAVNAILKALKIKNGKGWEPDIAAAAAFAAWQFAANILNDGTAMVKLDDKQWTRIEL